MIRVHVFVEGQTEETFVRKLLEPYFSPREIYLDAILVRTGPKGKGGTVKYNKIRTQIQTMLKADTDSYVSTMLDLYGLPADYPGMQEINRIGDPLEQACHIEESMEQDLTKDLANKKFIANIMVHEFEALLYSDPNKFRAWFDDDRIVSHLERERSEFQSPEHINNSRVTAPSKRILDLCPGYDKVLHGANIATKIGLPKIRQECKHFNNWIDKLSSLQR